MLYQRAQRSIGSGGDEERTLMLYTTRLPACFVWYLTCQEWLHRQWHNASIDFMSAIERGPSRQQSLVVWAGCGRSGGWRYRSVPHQSLREQLICVCPGWLAYRIGYSASPSTAGPCSGQRWCVVALTHPSTMYQLLTSCPAFIPFLRSPILTSCTLFFPFALLFLTIRVWEEGDEPRRHSNSSMKETHSIGGHVCKLVIPCIVSSRLTKKNPLEICLRLGIAGSVRNEWHLKQAFYQPTSVQEIFRFPAPRNYPPPSHSSILRWIFYCRELTRTP